MACRAVAWAAASPEEGRAVEGGSRREKLPRVAKKEIPAYLSPFKRQPGRPGVCDVVLEVVRRLSSAGGLSHLGDTQGRAATAPKPLQRGRLPRRRDREGDLLLPHVRHHGRNVPRACAKTLSFEAEVEVGEGECRLVATREANGGVVSENSGHDVHGQGEVENHELCGAKICGRVFPGRTWLDGVRRGLQQGPRLPACWDTPSPCGPHRRRSGTRSTVWFAGL